MRENNENEEHLSKRKNWILFSVIGIITLAVIYLAIFQDVWYRVVVLTVLITGGILIYRQLAAIQALLLQ
jgi:hypothetical protein